MARYIMSLDCGTSSIRCVLFDLSGRPISSVSRSVPLSYPAPGYVEEDAEEIWTKQISAAFEAMTRAECTGRDIAAIGITNQRETVILWDRKTGEPVCPAVVWQCRRTAERCAELRTEGAEFGIKEKTGLVADPYFSATKIEWLLDHIPMLRARAERGEIAFGTVDSWLLYRLSGKRVHLTDVSNASRTMLFDLRRGEWDEELCGRFRIPMVMLPRVLPSAGCFAESDEALLGARIPICGVAGDQQASLYGHGCFAPGELKNTYGTGGFLLLNTGAEPILDRGGGLITTVAWDDGGGMRYALEGSVFVCGAAVQWLRDGLGILDSSADSERLASSVPDSGGVTVVPAFTGLGAPYWDASARGAVFGLTRASTAAHLCRATLEAMAFQTVDVVREMERVTESSVRSIRADGGAAQNNLLMQLQADLLGVPVRRPDYAEITARGAAMLAAVGAGVIADPSEMTERDSVRVFEPTIGRSERKERYAVWQNCVSRVRENCGK